MSNFELAYERIMNEKILDDKTSFDDIAKYRVKQIKSLLKGLGLQKEFKQSSYSTNFLSSSPKINFDVLKEKLPKACDNVVWRMFQLMNKKIKPTKGFLCSYDSDVYSVRLTRDGEWMIDYEFDVDKYDKDINTGWYKKNKIK